MPAPGITGGRTLWKQGVEALISPSSGGTQRNRVTCGDVQLRLGQDGRWYRLLKSAAGWDLDGPAADDPSDLIDND